MKKIVATLAGVAASALIATAALLTVGSPAQALPSGCVSGFDGDGAGLAYCTSGMGEFRALLTCRERPSYPGDVPGTYTRAGSWRTPGQQYFSKATCRTYPGYGTDSPVAVSHEVRIAPPDLPTGPMPTVIG